MKTIGIAADHGGFALKQRLASLLRDAGYDVKDFGAAKLSNDDDYPDFVIPLARAVAAGTVARGLAVCGSGVGASVAANKIPGARAAVITDPFSAHQGVEDDDLNILCLGGRVIGESLAWELVQTFLAAKFSGAERHRRRLAKVQAVEHPQATTEGGESRRPPGYAPTVSELRRGTAKSGDAGRRRRRARRTAG